MNDIIEFLSIIEKNNFSYASWKNNHELSLSLSGKSDLDILVSGNENSFKQIASSNGWLELYNHVAIFPNILHFYKVSSSGAIFHLHVYFEVITGESWIKEYKLPLKELILENRIHSSDFNIWILNKQTQAYIFLLRYFIKNKSLFSRLNYLRDIDSYNEEWELCKIKPRDLVGFGPIDIDSLLINYSQSCILKPPSIRDSRAVRKKINTYIRYKKYSLTYRRLLSFIKRIINKIFYKRKKLFRDTGFIVAISGPDGSGKSSIIEGLDNKFSSFISCKHGSLGKPQGRLMEALRVFFNKHRKNASNSKIIYESSNHQTSLKNGIFAIVLSLLRLKESIKLSIYARQGYLILVDRWPGNETGKMDSPKIIIGHNPTFLIKFLAKIETIIYKKIPYADLCIFLDVDVNIAISRNESRIKVDKETKEEIIYRHDKNKYFTPKSKKIIRFKNNGSLLDSLNDLSSLIVDYKINK